MSALVTSFPLPWPEESIAHYTAYRTAGPISIDGRLDEESWIAAPRSARFSDLISGRRTIHDTRAAVLWDERNLYVGFWIEEPFVSAFLSERDAPIYTDNDVEVFIAGKDAYYEFEINALGTIYEVFFIWDDAYQSAGFEAAPEFRRGAPGVKPFPGVGFKHPRGARTGYWNWDLRGLQSAVFVDGTLNDHSDRDRGWTVELAFPWQSLKWLADGRSLPPSDGDIWRMDFSRFNQYKEAPPAEDSGGWAWSPHGVWDSHIPECFPYIHFSTETVGKGSFASGRKVKQKGDFTQRRREPEARRGLSLPFLSYAFLRLCASALNLPDSAVVPAGEEELGED